MNVITLLTRHLKFVQLKIFIIFFSIVLFMLNRCVLLRSKFLLPFVGGATFCLFPLLSYAFSLSLVVVVISVRKLHIGFGYIFPNPIG